MATEIRGIRRVLPTADGDTIHVGDFEVFRNKRRFRWAFPKRSLTKKGLLKIRLLGIDTGELHYNGYVPGMKALPKGKRPAKIPPQDPWATAARDRLNRLLPDGARVIIELDKETVDQYKRVLGYVWSVRGTWRKDELLNTRLVREGHAFPYQIWPNIAEIRSVKKAAKAAISGKGRGVFAAHSAKLLSLAQVARGRSINEPFAYRKVVDRAVYGLSLSKLFRRYVGDIRSWKYYGPRQYGKIPLPYRLFFQDEKEAIRFGFAKA